MINISTIKTHMFCPRNLYIQTYVDKEEENNYQLAIEIKKLKIDIQDLIKYRHIHKKQCRCDNINESGHDLRPSQ